jgi:hypothetical protein
MAEAVSVGSAMSERATGELTCPCAQRLQIGDDVSDFLVREVHVRHGNMRFDQNAFDPLT